MLLLRENPSMDESKNLSEQRRRSGGAELDGRRVLVFAENDYEDLELWYPKLRLEEAGAAITVAGPREKSYRSKHGYPVETDGNVADYRAADFDALVVPGGWCPDRFRPGRRSARTAVSRWRRRCSRARRWAAG